MTYNTARRKPLRGPARQAFLNAHGRICYWCGEPIVNEEFDDEHVLARELGGSDDMANRKPIHRRPCHKEKTAEDRRLIAKGNRIRRKISGLDPPSTRRKKLIANRKTAWPKRSMEKRVK